MYDMDMCITTIFGERKRTFILGNVEGISPVNSEFSFTSLSGTDIALPNHHIFLSQEMLFLVLSQKKM
jgi:hypothetical protein